MVGENTVHFLRQEAPPLYPSKHDTDIMLMDEISFELNDKDCHNNLPPGRFVEQTLKRCFNGYFTRSETILEEILEYSKDIINEPPTQQAKQYLGAFTHLVNTINTSLKGGCYKDQSMIQESLKTMIDHYYDIEHDMNNLMGIAFAAGMFDREWMESHAPLIEHGLRILRGNKGWDSGFPVEGFPLLEEVIMPATAIAERKGFAEEMEIEGKETFIEAAEDQIYQVIFTLMKNAKSHGRNGGRLRIGLDLDDATIDMMPGVSIIVKDNGKGFPNDYQGIRRGYSLGPGLGLGLAYSQNVAARHGGTLSIRPNGYGGERFPGACIELVIPKHQETYVLSPLLKDFLT